MDLDTFLAHAVRLEHEAVETYEKFAEALAGGPQDSVAFLREMAHYARLHLGEIMGHAGCNDPTELPQPTYQWAGQLAPESLSPLPDSNDPIDLDRAMAWAHEAEKRAAHFYEDAAQTAQDPRVSELALQFAAEEHGHVLALERFMGLKPY